jgi:hypothetical protein
LDPISSVVVRKNFWKLDHSFNWKTFKIRRINEIKGVSWETNSGKERSDVQCEIGFNGDLEERTVWTDAENEDSVFHKDDNFLRSLSMPIV